MDYIKIVEKIAADHNSTPEEIDTEIRKALEAAHIDIEPELFISIIASELKKNLQ